MVYVLRTLLLNIPVQKRVRPACYAGMGWSSFATIPSPAIWFPCLVNQFNLDPAVRRGKANEAATRAGTGCRVEYPFWFQISHKGREYNHGILRQGITGLPRLPSKTDQSKLLPRRRLSLFPCGPGCVTPSQTINQLILRQSPFVLETHCVE